MRTCCVVNSVRNVRLARREALVWGRNRSRDTADTAKDKRIDRTFPTDKESFSDWNFAINHQCPCNPTRIISAAAAKESVRHVHHNQEIAVDCGRHSVGSNRIQPLAGGKHLATTIVCVDFCCTWRLFGQYSLVTTGCPQKSNRVEVPYFL